MTVVALAGRRADKPGSAPARFPVSNIQRVLRELRFLFIAERVDLLICAAASGADLLALKVAEDLQIASRIILPFDLARFRRTSVVDRSDEWGVIFDEAVARAKAVGELQILGGSYNSDGDAYASTTEAIIQAARQAAAPGVAIAVLVWDGQSRGPDDFAEQFHRLAIEAGMIERVILTR